MNYYLTLFVFIHCSLVFAQPGPPHPITWVIIEEDSTFLKDLRKNKYLASCSGKLADTVVNHNQIKEYFYFDGTSYVKDNFSEGNFINGKNYHSNIMSGANGNLIAFFFQHFNINFVRRISFLEKETKKEMIIYLQICSKIAYKNGDMINVYIKNISFKEGVFFFVLNESNVQIAPNWNFSYEDFLLDLKDIKKYRIQESELEALIKQNDCNDEK